MGMCQSALSALGLEGVLGGEKKGKKDDDTRVKKPSTPRSWEPKTQLKLDDDDGGSTAPGSAGKASPGAKGAQADLFANPMMKKKASLGGAGTGARVAPGAGAMGRSVRGFGGPGSGSRGGRANSAAADEDGDEDAQEGEEEGEGEEEEEQEEKIEKKPSRRMTAVVGIEFGAGDAPMMFSSPMARR